MDWSRKLDILFWFEADRYKGQCCRYELKSILRQLDFELLLHLLVIQILGNVVNLSVLQFPHLYSENSNHRAAVRISWDNSHSQLNKGSAAGTAVTALIPGASGVTHRDACPSPSHSTCTWHPGHSAGLEGRKSGLLNLLPKMKGVR